MCMLFPDGIADHSDLIMYKHKTLGVNYCGIISNPLTLENRRPFSQRVSCVPNELTGTKPRSS